MVDTYEEAEQKLRQAFYEVKEELKTTKEEIDFLVNKACIESVQKDRENMLEPLKHFKEELSMRFRNYRVIGRVKSLTSIFGKCIQERSTCDAFGIKIITNNTAECMELFEWICEHFKIIDFDEKSDNKIKYPKSNGYRHIKCVIEYPIGKANVAVEIIIQSQQMYVDSHTIQAHELVYPWKYNPAILNLPKDYREMKF